MIYPDNAWVSPKGDIYPCELHSHIDEAEEILKHLSIELPIDEYPDDYLIKMGYCKLQMWLVEGTRLPINFDKLTHIQNDIIDQWLEERNGADV
jgi:MoaA/NifB/PqqE/SkfB family radical SAM enzyme